MREYKELFLLIFGLPIGIWTIYSSWKNSPTFFESRKTSLFVSWFGRNGARIFYGIVGLFITVISISILVKFISA